jgi:phage-related minor tail protein
LVPILPAITAFFEAIREGHPVITFIVTAISTLLAFRLAAWFIEASVAVRAFSVALAANPLGLLAVAISTTVAALVSLRQWFRKSTESAAEYNKTIAKTIELTNINLPSQQKSVGVLAKRNELQTEAKRIFEQTRTPLEKQTAEMEKLNKLLKEGLIDQDTYNRAMHQSSGALNDTAAESEGLFSMIESRSGEASKSLIDNFAGSAFGIRGEVKSLKDTFNDFFSQLQSDMLKMSLKQGMQGLMGGGGISDMLGGLFGGGTGGGGMGGLGPMFAGFFASGGKAKVGKAHVVGDGGEPELFIPSSSGTIVPFSELENGRNSSPNIMVNMNIQTPDVASFNYSRSQIAADMARQITRSSRNL